MGQVRVIPVKGARVRDNITKLPIPEEGKVIEYSIYWPRLAERGDVTIETIPEPASGPTKSAKRASASREE